MGKIALALSGGGSKGAFTVGVLKALDQLLDPAPYPVISGTSTGALIGTLLTTNDFAKLVEIYSTVQTQNIVNPNHALVASILGTEAVLFAAAVLGGRSIFDTAALRETIRNNADFTKVKAAAAHTLLIYNTVDLQSGMLECFDNKTHSKSLLAEALLASANMPVLMDPVPMPLDGEDHQFVDGGVREFLPLKAVFAADADYDCIIAISTAPLRPRREGFPIDKITTILARTIELLDGEVSEDDFMGAQLYNAILKMISNARKAGMTKGEILAGVPEEVRAKLKDKAAAPVFLISPDQQIALDSLTFEPEAMRRVMAHGLEVGKRRVPEIATEMGWAVP